MMMYYKILLQRLLASLSTRSLIGALFGFFVFSVGTASNNTTLVVVGLVISILEIWDLYEDKS